MNQYPINRRQFLFTLLCLPCCSAMGKEHSVDFLLETDPPKMELLMLQQVIPEYNRNDIKKLTGPLSKSSPSIDRVRSWWKDIIFTDDVSIYNIRDVIEDKIAADFCQRQTQFVRGWLMSETEMKLSLLANIYFN